MFSEKIEINFIRSIHSKYLFEITVICSENRLKYLKVEISGESIITILDGLF